MMKPKKAIAILMRFQEPEAYEPQITQDVYDALEMAIKALKREEKDSIRFILKEDGTAEEYDDTYDIAIHCTSEDEQREVLKKIESAFKRKETEIVRCAICRNYYNGTCALNRIHYQPYAFCDRGERKSGE